jgi:hypothetical protein
MSYTLTITFSPASPAPANGYRVRYWDVLDPLTVITVTPNPVSSPATVSGLAAGSYEGTIESACGGGLYSTPVPFSASTSILWEARFSNDAGTLCSTPAVTVYTATGESFSSGTTVYSDAALTTPLTGYSFISELVAGTIYNINSGTAVIGTPTGDAC